MNLALACVLLAGAATAAVGLLTLMIVKDRQTKGGTR